MKKRSMSCIFLSLFVLLQSNEYCARKSPTWAFEATDKTKKDEIRSDAKFDARNQLMRRALLEQNKARGQGLGMILDFPASPVDFDLQEVAPKKAGEVVADFARLEIKK